jgi:hypothetical protein
MKINRKFLALATGLLLHGLAGAAENVIHAPYAQWANLPDPGQLKVGFHYEESEAYAFWDSSGRHSVDYIAHGEHYGIDVNQGYISFDYGLSDRWALDFALGATTVGWRAFSNFSTNGAPQSTTGGMDVSLGVRYQIFREGEDNCRWKPDLTFRAGAVLPGIFDENFPFAPGDKSTAIEPELLMRKHFGWTGFGGYLDSLFRWNHTSANDHYIVSAGFFQQIQRWELDAGYRHLGSVGGDDIQYDPTTAYINYPRAVREANDSIEAGFHYTSPKQKIKVGFTSRTVFDGGNTDKKFWIGGFIEFPFHIGKQECE